MAQSQAGFILIRIDLHCHLEVRVAQQGHFEDRFAGIVRYHSQPLGSSGFLVSLL